MNLKNTIIPFKSSQIRTILFFCFSIFAFYGCNNNNDDLADEENRRIEAAKKQLAVDTVLIKNYILTNNIPNAKRSPYKSGIFYAVQTPGTGDSAVVGKTMVTHYVVKDFQGNILDTSRKVPQGQTTMQPYSFILGDRRSGPIYGYQESVALMRVGERTTFFLPSGLAYGTTGSGSIPPNTNLIFDIELMQIK